jgi:hypothetical protein
MVRCTKITTLREHTKARQLRPIAELALTCECATLSELAPPGSELKEIKVTPIKFVFVKTTTNFHRYDEVTIPRRTTGSFYIPKSEMPVAPLDIEIHVTVRAQ